MFALPPAGKIRIAYLISSRDATKAYSNRAAHW